MKVVPLPHARSEVWQYFGFIAGDDGEIQDKKKVVCKLCATTLSYSGNTTNLFTHLKALHPEATPAKLAPTSKPIRGRKGKFKFIGLGASGDSVDNENQEYIVRAITFGENESGTMPVNICLGDDTSPSTTEYPCDANAADAIVLSTSDSFTNNMDASNAEVDTSQEVNPENVPLLACDDITNAIVNMLVEDCRPICLTQGKGFAALIKFLAPGYKMPDASKLKTLVKKRHKEVQRSLILRGLDEDQ